MGFESVKCSDLPPANSTIQRFDARYWVIDYPLSCVATIVADTPDELVVRANFRSNLDSIGLLWHSDDQYGHPLFQYITRTDYSGVVLAFQAKFDQSEGGVLTIANAQGEHILRLFPYRISGDALVPNPRVINGVNESTGRLKSYPLNQVAPDATPISGLDWFVVDFDNLYTGYSFNETKVSPDGVHKMFISISPLHYGLGVWAKVADVGRPSKLKTEKVYELTIENVSPDLIITRNDQLTVQVNFPDVKVGRKGAEIKDWIFNSFDFIVGEHRGLGTTKRHFKLLAPIDALWLGGNVSATKLHRPSPIGNVEAVFRMANMRVTGIGETFIPRRHYPQPEHSMQMTSGYDDTYNLTPWRQVEQTYQLGYRGRWVSYVGMSHYFKANGKRQGEEFVTVLDKGGLEPLNEPTRYHFENFFDHLAARGYNFVWSSSYEILDSYMPESWKQRNADGGPALSGWNPPSAFIVPTNQECLDYLGAVISQGMELMESAGLKKQFQIGEPWWWDGSYTNNMPCIYDDITRALYTFETGNEVPTPHIRDYTVPVTEAQRPYLEWLGDKLGQSTNAIRDYVKARHPDSLGSLLFFTPQIMTPSSEMLPIINFPKTHWQYPEYDFMQMEDYDWLIDNRLELNPLTYEAVEVLGYPKELVDYFLGFVLTPQQTWIWPNMNIVAKAAKEKGFNSLFVWAYPQVIRDGITYSDQIDENTEVVWPSRNRGVEGVKNIHIRPQMLLSIADIHVCTGTAPVVYGEVEWLPVGGYGSLEVISEDTYSTGEYWRAALQRIDIRLLPDGLPDFKNASCEIFLSVSPEHAPIRIAKGTVSQQDFEVLGMLAKVVLRISNPLIRSNNQLTSRYTHADQINLHPDDMGLEFLARMQQHTIEWGSR